MSSGNGHDPNGIVMHSNGEDFAVETAPGMFVPEIDPVTRQPTGKAQRLRFATGTPVAVSLAQPTTQRRKSASLSSVERSALMDELVDQLIALKRVVDANEYGVTEAFKEINRRFNEHRAILDAHAGVVNRMTLWARLRWVVTGR